MYINSEAANGQHILFFLVTAGCSEVRTVPLYTWGVEPKITLRPSQGPRRLRWIVGLMLTVVVAPLGWWALLTLWLPDHILYVFEGSTLTIETGRSWWRERHEVDLSQVADVYVAQLQETVRIDGIELPGYVVGRFAHRGLGEVWQATSGSHDVIVLEVVSQRTPVVVSPADFDTFLWAVRAGRELSLPPPRVEHRPGWWAIRAGSLVPVLLVLMVPVMFFVAPAVLQYRLQGSMLTVRSLLMGSRRVDLAGADVTVRRHCPQLKSRGLAISIPGYYAGTFTDEGEPTLVFARSTTDGVLISSPSSATRLFIAPREVEPLQRFLTPGE